MASVAVFHKRLGHGFHLPEVVHRDDGNIVGNAERRRRCRRNGRRQIRRVDDAAPYADLHRLARYARRDEVRRVVRVILAGAEKRDTPRRDEPPKQDVVVVRANLGLTGAFL
jgi:hypothetical protein